MKNCNVKIIKLLGENTIVATLEHLIFKTHYKFLPKFINLTTILTVIATPFH